MRLLVCGDRNWTDKELIREAILLYPETSVIIEGEQRGADILAREVARELKIQFMPFPADWSRGKRGGHIRNTAMLKVPPDLVLGFFDDITKSVGTTNCLSQAHDMRIEYALVSH